MDNQDDLKINWNLTNELIPNKLDESQTQNKKLLLFKRSFLIALNVSKQRVPNNCPRFCWQKTRED